MADQLERQQYLLKTYTRRTNLSMLNEKHMKEITEALDKGGMHTFLKVIDQMW